MLTHSHSSSPAYHLSHSLPSSSSLADASAIPALLHTHTHTHTHTYTDAQPGLHEDMNQDSKPASQPQYILKQEQEQGNNDDDKKGQSTSSECLSMTEFQIKIEQEQPPEQNLSSTRGSSNSKAALPKPASRPLQTLHRSISPTVQAQFLLTEDHQLITTIIQSTYSSTALISPFLHSLMTQSQCPLFQNINIYESTLNARELPQLLKGIFFDGAGLFAHLKQTQLLQFNTVRKQKNKNNQVREQSKESEAQCSYFVNFYVKQVLPDNRIVTRTCEIEVKMLEPNQHIFEQVRIKKWKSLEQKFIALSQELQDCKSQYQRVTEQLEELKQSIPKIMKKETSKQKKTNKSKPKKQISKQKEKDTHKKIDKPKLNEREWQSEANFQITNKSMIHEKQKKSTRSVFKNIEDNQTTRLSSSLQSVIQYDHRQPTQSNLFNTIKQQQPNSTDIDRQLAEIQVQLPTSQPDSAVQVKTEQQLEYRAYRALSNLDNEAKMKNKRVHDNNYISKQIISISDSSCTNNYHEQSQGFYQNRNHSQPQQQQGHGQEQEYYQQKEQQHEHQQQSQQHQVYDGHEFYTEIEDNRVRKQDHRPVDQQNNLKYEQYQTVQNRQQQKKQTLRSHKNAILNLIFQNHPKPTDHNLLSQQSSLTPAASIPTPISNITYSISSPDYHTLILQYLKLHPPSNVTVSLCLKCSQEFKSKRKSLKQQLQLVCNLVYVYFISYGQTVPSSLCLAKMSQLAKAITNNPGLSQRITYLQLEHKHGLICYSSKCDPLVQAINKCMKKLKKLVIIYPKNKRSCPFDMCWTRYVSASVDVKFVAKPIYMN